MSAMGERELAKILGLAACLSPGEIESQKWRNGAEKIMYVVVFKTRREVEWEHSCC